MKRITQIEFPAATRWLCVRCLVLTVGRNGGRRRDRLGHNAFALAVGPAESGHHQYEPCCALPAMPCCSCVIAHREPGCFGEYVNVRLAYVQARSRARTTRAPLRLSESPATSTRPYELNVGDEIQIESLADASLNRSLIIQPDGTVTLRLLGQVKASHHTVTGLRDELEEAYSKYYKTPTITVTPLKVNTKPKTCGRPSMPGRRDRRPRH